MNTTTATPTTPATDARVRACQHAVLRKLRRGHVFHSVHKEGSTRIFHDGQQFVRVDQGDWDATRRFSTDAEFLAFLHDHFAHDARRGTPAGSVPEARVWQHIQDALQAPAGTLAALLGRYPPAVWLAIVAVLVLSGVLAQHRYMGRVPKAEPVVLQAPLSAPPTKDWQAIGERQRQAVEAAKAAAAAR